MKILNINKLTYWAACLLLIGVILPDKAKAQTEDELISGKTRSIKDTYAYVQLKINRNQYYLNEYKVNSQNIRWKNDEIYQVTQQYYYSFKGKNIASLRLVKVLSRIGDKHYQQEYLYDLDGKLAFCYEKQNDENRYPYREFYAYFDQGKCINIKVDDEIIGVEGTPPYEAKMSEIRANADIYGQRFKEDMSILEN